MNAEQYLDKFEKDLRFTPGKDKMTVDAIIAKTIEYAKKKQANKNKIVKIEKVVKEELDE